MYLIITTATSSITGSMATYVEAIMDIQKETFTACIIKFVDPLMTIIIFDVF